MLKGDQISTFVKVIEHAMSTCKNCSQQEKSDKKSLHIFLDKITINICFSQFENNSE